MSLDIPTLFAVNVICSLTLAAATGLSAWVDPARTYWRSWALFFGLHTLSLAVLTIGVGYHLPTVILIGNLLLVPTLYFYYEGIRRLAGADASKRTLYIATAFVGVMSAAAYATGNVFYEEIPRLSFILGVCAVCLYRLREVPFATLTSRFGFTAACATQGGATLIHLFHALNAHRTVGTIDWDAIVTMHVIASIIFIVLSGTFLFALFHERTALENKQEALKDPLTDAFNRRAFDQYFDLLLARSNVPEFALMQFDLDHFKSVNDRFGHAAGDEVLIGFVEILRNVTPEPRIVARLGGEEFAVLASDITKQQAEETAELIRQTLEQKTFGFPSGSSTKVTASAGLYHGKGDGLPGSALMEQVDQRLYTAKQSGRNRIVSTQARATA